jgi:DNA-binding LacI/PurR family transcriptional regulator
VAIQNQRFASIEPKSPDFRTNPLASHFRVGLFEKFVVHAFRLQPALPGDTMTLLKSETSQRMVKKPVRLADVAKRADVSLMTASFILNPRTGSKRFSQQTVAKVRQAAKTLNYRPNLVARQLAQRKSNLIGVIIDSGSPMHARAVTAMDPIAAERGYRLYVGYTHEDFGRIAEYADDFVGRGVEGVLCMAHTYPAFGAKVPRLFDAVRHTVFVDEPIDLRRQYSHVTVDFQLAGQLMAHHLLESGRRRIALLMATSGAPSVELRRRGFHQAFESMGLRSPLDLFWPADAAGMEIDSLTTAKMATQAALSQSADAVIVGNDEAAIWLIRALSLRGIRVPDDIAVVSSSAVPLGRAVTPSITSADLRYEEVVVEAVRMLVRRMKRDAPPAEPDRRVLEPTLIGGESSGAVSS